MKEVVKRLPGVRGLRRWPANKWRVSCIAGDLARPPDDAEFNDTVDVEHYVARAGFRDVEVSSRSLWVTCWGRKPAHGA
jgi:hypothetical protein